MGYGQYCPLAQASQILCERWTLLVVRELIAGSTRFNELRRGVPLMSPTLLSRRLKQLEAAALKLADGDLTARATLQSKDELGEVAGAFNRKAQDFSAI